MNANVFLLLNLALSFYLVGAIWAVEVDIFRSWKLVDPKDFPSVQLAHWHKLPYWVFAPLALALMGSIALIWFHPGISPQWAIWSNLGCQVISHLLTAVLWGPWQAKLSKDQRGPSSPYLSKILATHWIRNSTDFCIRADSSHLVDSSIRTLEGFLRIASNVHLSA